MSTKISETEQNFDEFWNFMSAHFGTVGLTEHWVTVPKCALIKIQNSSKFCSV
jgi:hypothetical protein